jgi:hypothetical protein
LEATDEVTIRLSSAVSVAPENVRIMKINARETEDQSLPVAEHWERFVNVSFR